jgi:ribose transport system substrate-binding protein
MTFHQMLASGAAIAAVMYATSVMALEPLDLATAKAIVAKAGAPAEA